MPTKTRTVLHLSLYVVVTLLIATAFLADILSGGCPVP